LKYDFGIDGFALQHFGAMEEMKSLMGSSLYFRNKTNKE